MSDSGEGMRILHGWIIGILCGTLILFNTYLLFGRALSLSRQSLWAALIFIVLVCGIVIISLISAWMGKRQNAGDKEQQKAL